MTGRRGVVLRIEDGAVEDQFGSMADQGTLRYFAGTASTLAASMVLRASAMDRYIFAGSYSENEENPKRL